MPHSSVTLAEVQACLTQLRRSLRFARAVEAAFQEKRQRFHARVSHTYILPTALMYNAFLLVDWLVLPGTFWLSAMVHLGIVTPMLIVGVLVLNREPGLFLRETTLASMPVLIVAQIMFIYALNPGEAADQYQYLAFLVPAYMNVSLRPDPRFAIAAAALVCALYLGLLIPGASSLSAKVIGTTMMGATTYITLMTNWRMERDTRFAFLTRLADRLQREEAEAVAGRDALTGLANRRALAERMDGIWRQAANGPATLAVVMLDVDHFKAFNDRYGHPEGDRCLGAVADAIRAALRERGDLGVRYGGEEFLILLPEFELTEAVRLAEGLRRAIEALAIPHESLGSTGRVTVSLGVMAGPVAATTAEALIAGADTALYAAKRNGRNQVWPPVAGEARERGWTGTDLRVPGARAG